MPFSRETGQSEGEPQFELGQPGKLHVRSHGSGHSARITDRVEVISSNKSAGPIQ